MAEVSSLIYYPVKGCAGISVSQATVEWTGLAYDRAFMVVGPDGVFFSQRRHRVMATIRAEVVSHGTALRLSAPEMDIVEIAVSSAGAARDVSVFTWSGKGIDQGDQAADWFSTVLGTPCRLVKVPDDHHRQTSGLVTGSAGFSDGHAILVTSTASLALLNERIADTGAAPISMDRFRPNVVVSGWAQPHSEDRIRDMRIGSAEFGFAKVCVRCSVPLVDQQTGLRSGVEPIRTLARYRRTDKGVIFGMKAAVTRTGQLSIGDKVIVHSWAELTPSAAAIEPPFTAIATVPEETG